VTILEETVCIVASGENSIGEATAQYADVSDFDDAKRLIEETSLEHGRTDFVVNFVGILLEEISYKLSPADCMQLSGSTSPVSSPCCRPLAPTDGRESWTD